MGTSVFYLVATLSIFFSLMVIFAKNPVHSVLYLIVTFFTFTVHYILLNAQFLAVVNFIVYMGAIMVLFLFVLMLLNLNKENEALKSEVNELKARLAAIESMLSNANTVKQQTERPNIALEAGIQSGLLGDPSSNGIYKFPVRDVLVAPKITPKALSDQLSTKNRGKPAA